MNKAPFALRTLILITAFALLVSPLVVAQQGRDLQLSQTAGQSSGKRIALVIGNGAYTSSPLKNPPNDATDMAKALSNVGFTVEHGVDLTQRQMKAMIREFGQKLKAGGGQGLFYFAGHGIQLKGRNYLVPVDAEIASEADVEDQGVDANLIMGLMDEAGNGLNVVILDACRNNPFARSFRSAGNGLAQVDAPTGTLVAYSTAPGKVARDGTGRNGVYTAELLKQMSVPGLPVEEVMKRVRASLKQLTNGEQVPWESSSLVGNFYLNGSGGANNTASNPVSIPTNSPSVDPVTIELAYWDSIKSGTDPDDFKDYLAKYPNGQFVELATRRNNQLTAKSRETSTTPLVDSVVSKSANEQNRSGGASYEETLSWLIDAVNNKAVISLGKFGDNATANLSSTEKCKVKVIQYSPFDSRSGYTANTTEETLSLSSLSLSSVKVAPPARFSTFPVGGRWCMKHPAVTASPDK
jgi:hypothetical protein